MRVRKTVSGTGVALALGVPSSRSLRSLQASWTFPADSAAVPAARARVRDKLCGVLDPELCSDAELVTAELVANAAAASSGEDFIAVGVRLIGTSLVVEVFDRADAIPQLRCGSTFDEGGRGLLLVAALSHLWGWHPSRDGKVVWALIWPELDNGPA